MVRRRCVICGKNPPKKDAEGNETYAYPKTDQEARLWQISMQANDCCVDSIRKECCVCVEHIPEFVKRAKSIRIPGSSYEHKKLEKPKAVEAVEEAAKDESCQCSDKGHGCKCPLGVLLLNGASLPIYCAEGKSCEDSQEQPAEDGEPKSKDTKTLHLEDSDTEIIVKESDFKDSGGKCPDIDGTEVTVLRTPTEEEELALMEEEMEETEEQEEDTMCGVRKHRNSSLRGCTDVLLLGRGHHPTDDCPCQCELCSKTPPSLPDPDPCCQPCEPCPEIAVPEIEYFDQPPCGCECEQQARRELGKVIKTQKKRIKELEELLCRHNSTRNCLQRKLDDLYCEFGRLDDAESAAYESGVICPGRERGGPDCASVLTQPPLPEPPVQQRSRRSVDSRRSIKQVSLKPIDEDIESARDIVELPPPGEWVHWLAAQSPETDKFTRRPLWVNKRDDEMGRYSLRFSRGPSAMMYSNFDPSNNAVSNSTYTNYSNSNTNYSNSNTNYSNTYYSNSNTNTNYSNTNTNYSNTNTNYSNSNSNTNYNTNYTNSNTNSNTIYNSNINSNPIYSTNTNYANSIYSGVINSISQSKDSRSYRSGVNNSISQSQNNRSYRSQA